MKRLALVTGGVRGIGAAIAAQLKNDGYSVIVNSFKTPELDKSFFETTGIPVVPFDVSNGEECLLGVERIEREYGHIEVLVLNAGITRDSFLSKMMIEQWDDVIRTNLSSCFYMTRAVISSMMERNFGRIIAISSINALKGQKGQTNYCAAKAGIIGFVKALAQESIQKGITVNAVAPGYTDTEMVRQVPANILNKIIEQIPAGRLAHVEEIARCVSFLAGEGAGYITGETINVNGGQYMY